VWIRSQEKTSLIDAKAINVVPYSSQFNGPTDIFRVYAWSSTVCEDEAVLIGRYIDKEQGTKVLDMVQDQIENTHFDSLSCSYLTGSGNVQIPYQTAKAVFQMPSIEEVETLLSNSEEWTTEEILQREG